MPPEPNCSLVTHITLVLLSLISPCNPFTDLKIQHKPWSHPQPHNILWSSVGNHHYSERNKNVAAHRELWNRSLHVFEQFVKDAVDSPCAWAGFCCCPGWGDPAQGVQGWQHKGSVPTSLSSVHRASASLGSSHPDMAAGRWLYSRPQKKKMAFPCLQSHWAVQPLCLQEMFPFREESF